jgi:hypothetical protein
MLRVFLFAILISSCQCRNKSPLEAALEKGDTALTKKLARDELNKMRASITDSNFATTLDASLAIQSIQFDFQKADSTAIDSSFINKTIINRPDGTNLSVLMMKSYRMALEYASRKSDIDYFNSQLSLSSGGWLEKKFYNKSKAEALISLFLLQKDIALISAIEINADNDFMRQQLEEQYADLINNMRQK